MNPLPLGSIRKVLDKLIDENIITEYQWSGPPIESVPWDIVHAVAHNGAAMSLYQNVKDDSLPIGYEEFNSVGDIASPYTVTTGDVPFKDIEDFLTSWAQQNTLVDA